MGLKLSTNNQQQQAPRLRTYSASTPGSSAGGPGGGGGPDLGAPGGGGGQGARARARSLVNFHTNGHSGSLDIPGAAGDMLHRSSSPDSESSSPGAAGSAAAVLFGGRGPFAGPSLQVFSLQGLKCPVCSKQIASDDIEYHLVLCLTKPRISYNEDVLAEDKGECVICFEELIQGDTIARLPCLCIYHKGCIDKWFQVNRSCPEHPSD